MLSVNRVLHTLQLAGQGRGAREAALEQRGLKPTVKPFHRAIAIGLGGWNEHGFHAKAQTETDDAREVTGGWPPAHQFAGIVELHLFAPTERFPTRSEEGQDRLHLAGAAQFQAHRTLKHFPPA